MGISKVVVRYMNGGIAKGFTQNFSPDKDSFYLYANPSLSGKEKIIRGQSYNNY